jgi:hypothetical protein
MKEKEKISNNVELRLGDVVLNISVTEDLKREEGNLKNFGYIQISNGMLNEENECFWDNPIYFFDISAKKFNKECGEDLKKGRFDIEETRKNIKKLLKRAFKLGILTKE